ncbi:DUF29 domain-containing protein [Methylobacterium sp. J-030]|uniref:DUF29 domain-containing protein n=1 Tax=Methylobacterium sp. J-030 TaxID=2836627 RepID=UPI001FB9A49D|nr:DUF29 domain-containing protein [Methylobacterium sp. J-030]MCJ2067653.1 DUF29 domain-containing protein [Methylobacterium sp. J-030]
MAARKPAARGTCATEYEQDVNAWAQEQARFLRAGAWSRLDIEHVVDEIADVGRGERHALTSALGVILLHLLTWDHRPDRRSRSWVTSIRTQRCVVENRLEDSPSLRAQIEGLITRAYHRARIEAAGETGLDEDIFPAECPYAWEAIMERPIPWPPGDGRA